MRHFGITLTGSAFRCLGTLLCTALLSVALVHVDGIPARAASTPITTPAETATTPASSTSGTRVEPVWTTGVISDNVGRPNIVVTHLTGDGVADVVACSSSAVYVLNKLPKDSAVAYDTTWFSDIILCTKVTTADRDADQVREIYAADARGTIYLFRGDTFTRIAAISLPGAPMVNDLAVQDVDGDGVIEIIVVTAGATFVYDGRTLALEWQASGLGGSQLGVGDVDGDRKVDLVVNGQPGRVLDPVERVQKWAWEDGWGIDMSVGDVDGDAVAEIAYLTGGLLSWSDVYLWQATTRSERWHLGPVLDWIEVEIGDANRDGRGEVLVGSGQQGLLTAYRGVDGVQVWQIPFETRAVTGIGIGDADNDGTVEVLWGANLGYTDRDVLYVGNWRTQQVEWWTNELLGPLHVAAADLDGDGSVEIVMASEGNMSENGPGTLRVYDGVTHRVKWTTRLPDGLLAHEVKVGQLDNDAAREIVVSAWFYNGHLLVYDGITHALQWHQEVDPKFVVAKLVLANVDADSHDEIITGRLSGRVVVYDGPSTVVLWDSGLLDGRLLDLVAGDPDGDGVADLAVGTERQLYIFRTRTWTRSLVRPMGAPLHMAWAPNPGRAGWRLLVAKVDYGAGGGSWLQALGGSDYHLIWQTPLQTGVIHDLLSDDLDGDGDEEIVLAGFVSTGPTSDDEHSVLTIASRGPSGFAVEYQTPRDWDRIHEVLLSDLDHDGRRELLLGSLSLIQVNEIILPGAQPAPGATLTPSVLRFGSAMVRSKGDTKQITLTNTGAADIGISSISAKGDYTAWHTCPATLLPGRSCVIRITFVPSRMGSRLGTVTVNTSAAGSPHFARLDGRGATPMVSATTNSTSTPTRPVPVRQP